jgi:tetratricopeptide (TPR) repeat protein
MEEGRLGLLWERWMPAMRAMRGFLSNPRLPWTAAAAAVAVLVLALFGPGKESPWEDLARIEPLAYVPIETRDAGAAALFERGMVLYAAGRYEEAATVLESVVEGEAPGPAKRDEVDRADRRGMDDRERRGDERRAEDLGLAKLEQAELYLGICFLLSDDAPRAVAHLERASRSSLPVLADRARWYLAQASLVMDDPEAAVAHLQGLADRSPGYGAQARRQLDDLTARLGLRTRE